MIPMAPPRLPRMYIHSPSVVFAATVNLLDPPEYPISFVAYNGVTVGSYTDLVPGYTMCLGSTPGADDLGRQRIVSGSDAISIRFGYSSRGTRDGELLVIDNAYITVKKERRLWSKNPFIDSAGEVFKDVNIEVGDNNEFPPPIALMTPGTAATAVDDALLVLHSGANSYAVADGATITDFLWDTDGGTLVGGMLTDDNIIVSYAPGFYYPSLKVTDSNGKSHTTWRPVYIEDPNNRLSTTAFMIESHTYDETGTAIAVKLYKDFPRDTYPDGTLVMIWDSEPLESTDRSHLLFIGWHDSDSVSLQAQATAFLRDTTLRLLDASGRLNKLPGFAQTLNDEILRDEEVDPETTWQFMPLPNMDKFIHFLIYWHSDYLENASLILSGTWDEYPFVQQSVTGQSIYQQIAQLATKICPDFRLIASNLGDLRIVSDQHILDVELRTDTIVLEFAENQWSEVSFNYNRPPSFHVLWGNATLTATNYITVDDDEVISSVRSIAPGKIYGQGGGESTFIEQLAKTQAALNAATGHRYGRINSRYGPLPIKVPSDLVRANFHSLLDGWIVLHVGANHQAHRQGLASTLRGILQGITFNYQYGETALTQDAILTIELETSGEPALSYDPSTGEATPGDGDWEPPVIGPPPPPPTAPPAIGLREGVETVFAIDGMTGANPTLYRTFDFQTPSGSGGPTYTGHSLAITDGMLRSFVVDPFSPGYAGGGNIPGGAINGWAVGDLAIWRIEDMGGVSPSATSIYTFPIPINSTSRFHSRTIQASFGTYFGSGDNPWLMVVSHYADTSGHTGTWANYSKDAGATWSGEKLISSYYDSDVSGAEAEIICSCHLSPKTPGLALACAYHATGNPATAAEFKSIDWGETWVEQLSSEDVLHPLPKWGYYDDNDVFSFQSTSTIGHLFNECLSTGPVKAVTTSIVMAPPPDAVRVEITAVWTAFAHKAAFGSVGGGSTLNKPSSVTRTIVSNDPGTFAFDTVYSGSFVHTYTYGGVPDWPEVNSETIISSPPTTLKGVRFGRNDIGSGDGTRLWYDLHVTVTEIELKDGTIYTPVDTGQVLPGHRLGAALHAPWLTNPSEFLLYYGNVNRGATLAYRLRRAELDASTFTDISPSHSGKLYGVNRSGFGVRTHDSNRSHTVIGGTANDATAIATDNVHAIFVSTDGGDTSTLAFGPIADSSFGLTKGFGVAFSGEELDVIFAWGAKGGINGTIIYSDDGGATFDDRSGNIAADFGANPDGFLGIAGGGAT